MLAAWLVVAAAGLLLLPAFVASLTAPAYEVSGSESDRANRLLGEAIIQFGREPLLLVLHSDRISRNEHAYRAARAAAVTALERSAGVTAVIPFGDPDPPKPVAKVLTQTDLPPGLLANERTGYALVGVAGDSQQVQDRLPGQRQAAANAARAASGGAVDAYLVGLAAFGYDMQRAEFADLARIELVAVPIAILVLLLGVGAPVAALLPLVVAAAGLLGTVALLAALSPVLPTNAGALIIASAMGLGIGIDYALFVVSRFREEFAAGTDRIPAAGQAVATSGRTVMYSGLIVMTAATSLLLVRWPIFVQAAIAGLAVVTVAVAASLTLAPALLVLLAHRLEWRPRRHRHTATDRRAMTTDRWARWARHLMRHPWPYLVGITAGLLLLAVPATDLKLGVNMERRVLAQAPTGAGLALVERDAPGMTGFVTVVVRRSSAQPAPDVSRLTAALRADPRVLTTATMDSGDNLTALFVIPTLPADSPDLVDLVHRIRGDIASRAGPTGHPILVGGIGGTVTDIVDECGTALWWVIGLILALMFALLVAALRSLLVPLKAIAMNLLVTAAVFGLVVMLFQHGAADGLFGFTSPGAVWPHIPLLAFALLFAVSMDYEMFLVRRIQEEFHARGDNTEAVAAGVQRTARPIWLAALIMIIAFGSLLISHMGALQTFGFAVAAAILIDATLIRLALVPAVMHLLGHWNWWLPTRSNVRRGVCRARTDLAASKSTHESHGTKTR